MGDTATATAVETPVTPLGELESLAEFRERRSKGDEGATVEAPAPSEKPVEAAKPEAAKPAATDEDEEKQISDASEAGKKLVEKRKSLQGRIDEVTRRAGERERELLAEIAALKVGGKPAAQEPAKPAATEPADDPNDPAPKVDDFDDYQKYVLATSRWAARQERKAAEREASGNAQARGFVEASARVEAAAKAAHADFDDTVRTFVAGGGVYSPVALDVILNHRDLGHEVAYVLAKDPALNTKIGQLPAPLAFLEIGKLIAKIEGDQATAKAAAKAAEKPAAAKVSKAPEPVAEVAAGETAAGTPDPSKMTSVTEWRKRRAEFDK